MLIALSAAGGSPLARLLPLLLSLALPLGCGNDHPSAPPPPQGPPPRPAAPKLGGTDMQGAAGGGAQPIAPGDSIARQMQLRAQQFAEGMEPGTQLFRGTLQTGANQDYQAVLQAGRCFRVIGVGAAGVTDLDLFLFDPNGVQVQQDTATDAYPVLGLTHPICPDAAGAYRVQVRMYAGSGDFGVQVWQTAMR